MQIKKKRGKMFCFMIKIIFLITVIFVFESSIEVSIILMYCSFILQNLVTQEGQSPVIFSQVWVRDLHKQIWGKAFLLLRDKKLYLSYKLQVIAKFLRAMKSKDSSVSDFIMNHLRYPDKKALDLLLVQKKKLVKSIRQHH